MSTQVQWKRGTSVQNNTYTGAIGEITVDTTAKQLRLHDGSTAGGTIIGGASTTATNLLGGSAGQIPYQTSGGLTSFFGPGTAGTVLVSYGSTGTPTFQNTLTLAGTTVASSTQTGALVVGGGVGIGGNLYVGGEIVANRLTIQLTTVTTTLVQTDDVIQTLNTTQSSSTITGALQVAGGAGIGLDITVGGSIRVASVVTATTFYGNLSGNLVSAGTGNIVYQSAANTTSFLSTGTSGQLLVAAGGAPVWTNTSSIYVNRSTLADTATNAATAYATIGTLSTGTGFYGGSFNGSANQTLTLNTATLMTTAVNLVGGAAGSLPYQTAAGTTTMLGLGTSGYVLTAGASAPAWSAISGLSAGNATTATNLANGQPGYIPYQTAPGATSFISTATTGNFLQANYVGAPTWTTTASMYVQDAVVSTNVRAGTAGQLPYQTGPGATSFVGPGSYGQFLMSTGASAPVYQSTITQTNGNIIITSNTAATSTATGALQIVNGGLGVGGSIYATGLSIAGISTQTGFSNFVGSGSQEYTVRFKGSTTGDQWAIGTSGTAGFGIANDVLNAAGTAYSTFTVSASVINLKTGNVTPQTALSINQTGQVGVGTNYAGTGGALFAVDGGGYFNGIVTATTYYGTFAGTIGGTTTINTASNIANGTAGQLHYQTAPGLTGFVNTSTPGNFLQANYVGAPTWTGSSTIQVGYAANVLGAGTGNLVYQSGNNTTALLSTGTTGQLLMAAGGAPVFTNTSSIYVAAATQVNTQLQTASANYYPAFVSANNAASSAMSVYTTSSFYINPASGNVTVGGALTVNSTAYNTATNTANAIYTPGAVYADKGLTVAGPVLFKDIVTFNGTATYVLSTNSYYTDNLIEMHTPPGGVYSPWFVDDGKDIGFRFHYYTNSTDTNAALVLDNTTKYLDWYSSGAEASNGDFSSGTFGTFRTGNIKLVSGTANAGNTSSGDLTVLGGVGVGGSIYVAGNITVAGAINATVNGTITSATNIAGGTAGQIHYQTAPGLTGFVGPGTFGQLLMSTGAGAPVYQSTVTLVQNTLTIAGNLSVNNTIITPIGSGANLLIDPDGSADVYFSTATQVYVWDTATSISTTTGALVVQGGVGIGGSVNIGGTITGGGIRSTSATTPPANPTVGDIWYNTSTDDIYRYTSDGTNSYWLDITGPSVTNVGSITAGNITGGTAGQVPYQSAPGTTSFFGPGTAGQLLVSAGASAPVYTNTASIYVNDAVKSTNLRAGTAGQLVYQSAVDTSGFISTATTGNFLQSNYVGAPTWTTTASMYVNRATVADAVAASGISGTIGNSQLTGSGAVTVTAGTGMGGGGSVALGSTVTLNATGTTINSTSSAYVLVAADAGKTISITTGGVTIPNSVMSAGNIVSIYNNSGSSQTITQGASLTLQWAGQSTSQTGNRTLGLYGMCTILFITASSAVITGSGLT